MNAIAQALVIVSIVIKHIIPQMLLIFFIFAERRARAPATSGGGRRTQGDIQITVKLRQHSGW
jgi:hypothetical protein